MLDLQIQSPKEIWEAKKILYESNTATKRAFIVSLATLVLLTLLLLFSIMGTQDSWNCKIDSSSNKKNQYLCTEMRRTVNCKTVSGPISGQIFLKFDKNIKTSADVICPWEIAISELRVCFILLSILCVVIGFLALKQENKKLAELHFQIGIFLSVLLLIAGYFDYLAISTSQTNNYNLCNLKEEFQVENDITGEMKCSFAFYNITVFIEILSSIFMFVSAQIINSWKSNLIIVDNL